MQKPTYKLSGRPVLTFSLPGEQFAPLPTFSYATGYDILYLHTVFYPYTQLHLHPKFAYQILKEDQQAIHTLNCISCLVNIAWLTNVVWLFRALWILRD